MIDFATLAIAMNSLRMFAWVLSTAMIFSWTPSLWRVLRGRERGRDAQRAIWLILAVAVFLFQVRWLYPSISDLARMKVWVIAQAGMLGALLAAIYHHGRDSADFNPRRTLAIHAAMLVVCVVFVSLAR